MSARATDRRQLSATSLPLPAAVLPAAHVLPAGVAVPVPAAVPGVVRSHVPTVVWRGLRGVSRRRVALRRVAAVRGASRGGGRRVPVLPVAAVPLLLPMAAVAVLLHVAAVAVLLLLPVAAVALVAAVPLAAVPVAFAAADEAGHEALHAAVVSAVHVVPAAHDHLTCLLWPIE